MVERRETAFSTASIPTKWANSFVVFYCNFAVGIILSLTGPALISFGTKYGTTVDHVSKILTVTLVCYLIGALSTGILHRFTNRQLMAMAQLFTVAASVSALPHMPSVTTFFIAGGVMGFGIGGFDVAQIAWIIDIWRDGAGPFILSQHFAYSVGTLAAPLLIGPFLPGNDNQKISDSRNDTSDTYDLNVESRLHIPFGAAGSILMVGVVAQVILFTISRTVKVSPTPKICDPKGQSSDGESGNPKMKILLMILCCCFIGFYQAMEMCTMQLLPTFAHFSEVGLSENDGAAVLSALTFGFAVARGFGILLVLKAAPQYILAANFLLLVVGNGILTTVGGASIEWMWVGSVCLGVGFSTVYPAFYAYIEKYIFVTEGVASIVTVSGGLLAAIYPFVVGSYVERNPRILNYVDFLSIAVDLISFLILFRITFRKPKLEEQDVKAADSNIVELAQGIQEAKV